MYSGTIISSAYLQQLTHARKRASPKSIAKESICKQISILTNMQPTMTSENAKRTNILRYKYNIMQIVKLQSELGVTCLSDTKHYCSNFYIPFQQECQKFVDFQSTTVTKGIGWQKQLNLNLSALTPSFSDHVVDTIIRIRIFYCMQIRLKLATFISFG